MKYLGLAVFGLVLTGCAINLDNPALQLASWVCYVVAFVGNKMKYNKENA